MRRPSDPDLDLGPDLGPGPWRPVTRRAFVTALGAAAAALAVRHASRGLAPDDGTGDDDRPPSRWTGTTRWIGHC
jgi:hypothetical protein